MGIATCKYQIDQQQIATPTFHSDFKLNAWTWQWPTSKFEYWMGMAISHVSPRSNEWKGEFPIFL